MSWRIIDEAPFARSFDCRMDVDGIGPLVPEAFLCGRGINVASFAPLADGVYITTLSAQGSGARFTRRSPNIVGSPSAARISGELTPTDAVDPDSGWRGFIDYFDLDGLSGSKTVLLQVETSGFNPAITLYDRQVRETQGRGGVLKWVIDEGDRGGPPTEVQMFFDPEPGIDYVVGVSRGVGYPATGTYTVTVVNEGTLVATTLDTVPPPQPPLPPGAASR